MPPFFLFERRWWALPAIFSLFSLLVFTTGDPSWLMYLAFLIFLFFLRPLPQKVKARSGKR